MTNQEHLKPLRNFLAENIALLSANVYLLTVEIERHTRPEGDITAHYDQFAANIKPTYKSPATYLMSRLFISYVAAFEVFLQETISLVIQKNPKKVGSIAFTLADLIDSSGIDELVLRATDEALNKLMYKKPSEYLREICAILSIDDSRLKDHWKVFVEAKARRDLGVHNAWRCNDVYRRKLAEVEVPVHVQNGASLAPQDKAYFDTVTSALNKLAMNITAQTIAKHWPNTDLSGLIPGAPS